MCLRYEVLTAVVLMAVVVAEILLLAVPIIIDMLAIVFALLLLAVVVTEVLHHTLIVRILVLAIPLTFVLLAEIVADRRLGGRLVGRRWRRMRLGETIEVPLLHLVDMHAIFFAVVFFVVIIAVARGRERKDR
jgi:hypothetical protein